MDIESNDDIQTEIEYIIFNLSIWNYIFKIKKEYFLEGYTLFLEEQDKNYPRLIVIHKKYDNNNFSIYSYERTFDIKAGKEKFIELYSIKEIENREDLLKNLKKVFCGVDILSYASQKDLKGFL